MDRILLLLFLFATFCFAGKQKQCGDSLPIIYDRGYNISVLGIEFFHPFDTRKYRKVYRRLRRDPGLCSKQFYRAEAAGEDQLKRVHADEYLKSLESSRTIARISEIPALAFLPTFILRKGILRPMLRATGGTILGAQLALKHGWAINLSGGYHHAKASNGEGFCFFADVPVALEYLWDQDSSLKVLIVDLDAHQGNGNSAILGGHPNVSILDIYNSDIYPHDPEAEARVDYSIRLPGRTGTQTYLDTLQSGFQKCSGKNNPIL